MLRKSYAHWDVEQTTRGFISLRPSKVPPLAFSTAQGAFCGKIEKVLSRFQTSRKPKEPIADSFSMSIISRERAARFIGQLIAWGPRALLRVRLRSQMSKRLLGPASLQLFAGRKVTIDVDWLEITRLILVAKSWNGSRKSKCPRLVR